jgi:hypothetical protein
MFENLAFIFDYGKPAPKVPANANFQGREERAKSMRLTMRVLCAMRTAG